MKIIPDDPRLTAYALGELDETGRQAVEAELKNSPECRHAVEEIRETTALLAAELATEELPDLTFAQQRKIESQLRQLTERPRPILWRILFYGGLSTATACLIGVLLLPALSKSKAPKQVATSQSYSQKDLPPVPVHETRTSTETPVKAVTIAPSADAASSMPGAEPGDQTLAVINSGSISSPVDKLALPSPGTARAKNPSPVKTDGFNLNVTEVALNSPPAPGFDLSGGKSAGQVVQLAKASPQEVQLNFQETPQSKPPRTVAVARAGGAGGFRNGGSTSDGLLTSGLRKPLSSSSTLQSRAQQNSDGSVGYDFAPASQDRGYASDSKDSKALGFDWYLGNSAQGQLNTATYPHIVENSFLLARNAPLSTFSIDVDTASYANMRRFLNEGRMPPRDAVRIEELINYFKYNYPQPRGEDPFSANIEVAGCPWNSEHRLVRVGLKGREIAQDKRPPSNFVFLIDVSGSMQPVERLPLIKQALRQLVKKMTANDRVAIVVYASEAGVKLPSTSCAQKETILEAIDQLGAGGSTAGAAGIQAAYRVAQENFIEGGVNRVLLATDGDFNVGMTDQNQLVKLIQERAKGGVFLTTLGVGTDNYKDALMQKLADKGNGNYHYLDTLEEAQKVLIDQMSGTLVTIAKDVKIQIEFNPSQVGAYRLIGYEKRMLRKEDFNNDAKDAGEIGAGHTVTALYEIVPPGREVRVGDVDDLKYQQPAEEKPERYTTTGSRELLTLKLRYKQPDGNTSKLLTFPVTDKGASYSRASTDFKFAAAVAEFGMLLRDSEFKGSSSYGSVLELAEEAKGSDAEGYRAEFLTLVRKARDLGR